MRVAMTLLLAICSVWFSCQAAVAGKRVALVIGNSAYEHVNRLANPTNDSDAIAAIFKSAGFDLVDLRHDLKANEMRRAIRDFSDSVRDADIAVVYFAGHGIEIDGTNYLIPVDAALERDIDAFDEAIQLDRLLAVIEPAKQLRLIILDACRDNPFGKTMRRTTAARAVSRGLAKVEPTSPNTLVAFAAKAGSTASDGDGKNSPFTGALVKYLPKPGLDVRKAFGFARDDVLKLTNNRQEPFIYGSLGGDDVALVPAAVVPSATISSTDPNATVRRDYELAERIGTKPVWDSFISNYPSGFYADLARAQRDKLGTAAAAATEKAAEQFDRLAATNPQDKARDGSSESGESTVADLPRLLQTELRRVGCNTGPIEGDWNLAAQKSLALFNRNAKTQLDTRVASLEALEALRAERSRVCPLICDNGYKADGENCNKIVCKAGFAVGDDNSCQRIGGKKRDNPLARLTPPSEINPDVPRDGRAEPAGPRQPSNKKQEGVKRGGCSSMSALCAVEIGGRCSNGHWEYGRNGAGGSTPAFDACIGRRLAGGRR